MHPALQMMDDAVTQGGVRPEALAKAIAAAAVRHFGRTAAGTFADHITAAVQAEARKDRT